MPWRADVFGRRRRIPKSGSGDSPTPTSRRDDATVEEAPASSSALSLQSLLELGHELAERNDLFEIADVALFNLMGHFGCSKAALWVVPETEQGVALLRRHGLSTSAARDVGEFWRRWLGTRPSGSREPVLVADLRSAASIPEVELSKMQDVAVLAPLATRRRLVGLVGLGPRVSGRPFRSQDLDVLAASLDYLGLALEGCQTRVRLVESNRQLRAANADLEETVRLRSDFLAKLSEGLRTPVTELSSHLEPILGDDVATEDRHAHGEAARAAIAQLEAMLSRVLDLRQLVQDRLDVDARPSDVAAILRVFVEERRPGLTASLRDLRFSAASELPPAVCDPRRVLQVVDCFVENAKKETPEGATIQIRVEATNGRTDAARVRVEVRGSEATEPAKVGLTLAERLAGLMNARIDVDAAPGRPSTFRLLLPTST
jgi:signal transduction histidine kinase